MQAFLLQFLFELIFSRDAFFFLIIRGDINIEQGK
jgi:hypothetical protein